MSNLSITDLKKGTIFQLDKVPYKVVDYSQKVMGRGGSIVNVKIKSLLDGKVLSKTFKGADTIQSADVTNSEAQYLYSDTDQLYFMDSDTYETFSVNTKIIGAQSDYLVEGQKVISQIFDGNVINVELPKNVLIKVKYAENAVKGDTSSSIVKEAELENGTKIKVPAFIKTGDIVNVDTTTGKYRERKKD
ncbi:MAG TPA: elongation factor P [Candidatus Saccharimonadales bacterium]|nr:elongation factor P [Candidatus Saccharimonadales bacterium]